MTDITDSSDIARPRSTADVVALVQQARATGQPLYPLSTGMNWGYGGVVPPRAGCRLVDLSGMNQIRNAAVIGPRQPVALIEPGVTQQQLHQHLARHAPTLRFNVTGSAASTSILGNVLDRGVGYSGPRVDDLFGLEVVVGTGEVIHTGFRRLGEDSPLAHCHRHGLGPLPDGLFFQGNFGIVTSACFRLQHKRPVELALSLGLRDGSRLAEFLDCVIALKRDALLTSVTHIGNASRARATLRAGLSSYLKDRCHMAGAALDKEIEAALSVVAGTPWTGLASLTGNAGQVRAELAEIRARLRGLAEVRTFSSQLLAWGASLTDRLRSVPSLRRYAAALSAVLPLQALARGVPTDVAFDNLIGLYDEPGIPAAEYGRSRCGVLFISPAMPMDGALIDSTVTELERIAQRHGHALYATINIETDNSVVAVINLLFDKVDLAQIQQAHACAFAMHAEVQRRGLEVYRARVDQMPAVLARNPEYWALLARLKAAWDPDGVIAPGRYSLV